MKVKALISIAWHYKTKIFPVLFYQIVRSDTDKDTKASEGALDKIRKRFFDDILCPKIIVKAIR